MSTAIIRSGVTTDAARLCRESIATHSKSFALASTLLSPDVRDDVAILYAYCRRADDAVDHACDVAGAAAALESLRSELESIYAGYVQADVTLAAMQELVSRRGIPVEYPAALLDGMAMDVEGARYVTLHDLLLYAYRVAGVVGLMMCHVLGVRRIEALPRAAHLGLAMQLTNVCRDVPEDWALGRMYLPSELLGNGAPLLTRPGDALPPAAHPAIRKAVRSVLETADRFYRSADVGMRDLSPRCAIAVRAARGVYSAIGDRLAERDHDPLRGRAVVSTSGKLARVAAALLRAVPSLVAAPFHPFRAAPIDRILRFPDDVLPLH